MSLFVTRAAYAPTTRYAATTRWRAIGGTTCRSGLVVWSLVGDDVVHFLIVQSDGTTRMGVPRCGVLPHEGGRSRTRDNPHHLPTRYLRVNRLFE